MHLLLVDDDPGLRALLRATFDVFDVEIDEAENTEQAARAIAERPPDAIVLDVMMPGVDGIEYCRILKADPTTTFIPVVLLTVVERLVGGLYGVPFRAAKSAGEDEQLLLYARDLRHMLEIERGQRALLRNAYHDTVVALASALESKDIGTRAHSQRVQRYAVVLGT